MPNAVVVVPVQLLADDPPQAVNVGDGSGDHAEQSLPRGERKHVADAPPGEDVGLDVHRNEIVSGGPRARGCVARTQHGNPRSFGPPLTNGFDSGGRDYASVPISISCRPLPAGTIGYTCSLGSTTKST